MTRRPLADRPWRVAAGLWAAAGVAAAAPVSAGPWDLPEPHACEANRGLVSAPVPADAPPPPFKPGQTVTLEQLELLRGYLPEELWTYRERFFYEGMKLEIGPCFRDYAPPAFFQSATLRHAGQASLNAQGGLETYAAGLPFSPDDIAPDDPKAGMKWAWNFANRYQAAGFRGEFRITDLLGLVGRAEPFDGEIFKMQLAQRSDLAPQHYQVPFAQEKLWVAGGLFFRPFNARQFSWRQYRSVDQQAAARISDELHAYVPTARRVRRLNASRIEGLYLPAFSVGVSQNADAVSAADAGAATTGNVGTIYPKRSGFEGLEIRPLLYTVRVLGLQDLLAPINSMQATYPEQPEREFGPWGLSLATDRWDLRRTLVLELSLRSVRHADQTYTIVYYLDLQTLHPLYYVSRDGRREIIDVGTFAGRWSEDRPDYPRWPDDPERPVRVIDSAAAAFANIDMHGSWRRESWDMVALPPSDETLRLMVSVGELTKRR